MSGNTAEYDVVLDHATQRIMRPHLKAGDRIYQRHGADADSDSEYMVVRAADPHPEGWFLIGEKGVTVR